MIERAGRMAVGFGRFWYGFVVGDDWTVAAAVAVALTVTWALSRSGVEAWWVVPAAVVVMLVITPARRRRR